jgi:ubiquinol-cytochrome c reductase cytochrome c subunit
VNRSRLKSILAIVLGTAIIAVISGCDAKENADTEKGRDLFIANCGTCHALKEAGSTSTVGPDLDASFAAARAAGMDQDTFEGVVSAQIEQPRFNTDEQDPTYMPAKILEGQEAEDVAAYVASVAGVPGIEPLLAAGGPGGQIFANNGCGACHTLGVSESTGNVGPNLDEELPGQSPDMIRESIIAPGVEIVDGFDNVMPENYEDSIPPADLDKLVNYLATCAGIGSSADGGSEEQEFEEDGSCAGVSPAGGGSKGGK